jgi:hypothetical protein
MSSPEPIQNPVSLTRSTQRPDYETSAAIAHFLMQRYGPLLDTQALVEVLKFPSRSAFERSIQRGLLTLNFRALPNRRGVFALAAEVADYLTAAQSPEQNSDDVETNARRLEERSTHEG